MCIIHGTYCISNVSCSRSRAVLAWVPQVLIPSIRGPHHPMTSVGRQAGDPISRPTLRWTATLVVAPMSRRCSNNSRCESLQKTWLLYLLSLSKKTYISKCKRVAASRHQQWSYLLFLPTSGYLLTSNIMILTRLMTLIILTWTMQYIRKGNWCFSCIWNNIKLFGWNVHLCAGNCNCFITISGNSSNLHHQRTYYLQP